MPKYMVIASYTTEGAKGLLKEGGTGRRSAVEKAVESIGGTLEGFYFALGSDDVYVLVDAPDNASAAAFSLVASAAGGVRARTVVLVAPEEIDRAAEKARGTAYRPPGA